MQADGAGTRGTWSMLRGLVFPLLIVASVGVIILPLPAFCLDLFLACNITVSVLILLTTIYVAKPLEFSVFPALLLGTTLVRLVLNLASTRLILTKGGTDKTAAAGHVIQAFGEFVAGDKLVVGIILFCILIAIQFLVITKGAGRISEVAARFFLDGMPGRQMAIDAELAAGAIDQKGAKARREEIALQADFYGSMDGASKFVRGDAIAGIVITLINVVGGLYVGVVEHSMSFGEAAEVYTKLTIGDGLVTQVPAFLISLASGLIVTRTSSDSDLPSDVVGQLFRHPLAMYFSAGFLVFLTITGLPKAPLFGLAAACAIVGWTLQKSEKEVVQKAAEESTEKAEAAAEDKPEDKLHVQPIMLELGAGLVPLADITKGGDLLDRVLQIRHQIADELGIIVPKVRVRDNSWLDINEYVISLRDQEVARGKVWPNCLLAINRGAAKGELSGISTTDPLTGAPAVWIEPHHRERASMNGYSCIEPALLVVMHLIEMIRRHADELLTRQHLYELIGSLKEVAPKLLEEVNPEKMKVSTLHTVLRNLLSERVPIRDLETILQTIVDNADRITNLSILTEYVRTALARTICQKHRDHQRRIHVVSLDPILEDFLRSKMDFDQFGVNCKLNPAESEAVLSALQVELKKLTDIGMQPVLLTTAPQVRAGLRQISSRSMPKLSVLCLNEVTSETQITSRGYVRAECLRGALSPPA